VFVAALMVKFNLSPYYSKKETNQRIRTEKKNNDFESAVKLDKRFEYSRRKEKEIT